MPKKKPTKPRKPTPAQLQKQKNLKEFEKFVKGHPTLSANQALKKFRSETGLSVGNEAGKDVYRNTKGKTKNTKKATRIKYKDISKSQIKYLEEYSYIISYQTGTPPNVTTEYITITSGKKIPKKKLLEEAEGIISSKEANDKRAKYNTQLVNYQSLKVEYAVHNPNPRF